MCNIHRTLVLDVIGRDAEGHSKHIAEIVASYVTKASDGVVYLMHRNENGEDEPFAYEEADGSWALLRRV